MRIFGSVPVGGGVRVGASVSANDKRPDKYAARRAVAVAFGKEVVAGIGFVLVYIFLIHPYVSCFFK